MAKQKLVRLKHNELLQIAQSLSGYKNQSLAKKINHYLKTPAETLERG